MTPSEGDSNAIRARIQGIHKVVIDFLAKIKILDGEYRKEMRQLNQDLTQKRLEEVKKKINSNGN